MKYTIFILFLFAGFTSRAQSFGDGAGTLGTAVSFFGDSAGTASVETTMDVVAIGKNALHSNTASRNTAVGSQAMSLNESGANNVAIGYQASGHTIGSSDFVAVGHEAGNNPERNQDNSFQTANSQSVAIGYQSLHALQDESIEAPYVPFGYQLVGIGSLSLSNISLAVESTAVGYEALAGNSSFGGSSISSAALGYRALGAGSSLSLAAGSNALAGSTSGSNTGIGANTLQVNQGSSNIAIGFEALTSNTTGSNNYAVGDRALRINTTGVVNFAIGSNALGGNTSGTYNIAIGHNAGPNGPNYSNTIAIGRSAVVTGSNQVRLGNANVTSIGGYARWSDLSDERFKSNLKDDVAGLDFINSLRPVSYYVDRDSLQRFLTNHSEHNPEADNTPRIRETGFIAQEVEKAVKKGQYAFYGVKKPENENDHYSLKYAAFVVPLVKSVQELNETVAQQEKQIEEQKKEINSIRKKISSRQKSAEAFASTSVATLSANEPNPFTTDTRIKFTIPEQARQAVLMIYSQDGKEISTMTIKDRGTAEAIISGSQLEPGLYLYSLIIDGKVIGTHRMILTH